MASSAPLSRRRVLTLAWPVIVANAAVPLLGLVDTAVIGNLQGRADLGAIALGALVMSFVYWGFGFLRMGTSGFVAQAAGAGDEPEVRATLGRGVAIGGSVGLVLVVCGPLIEAAAFELLSGSGAVEATARDYVAIRIWGAPAALINFVVMGVLIGLGKTRHLLLVQLFMNMLNIALDVVLAGALGMGVRGVALGTALSEWSTLGLGLLVVGRLLRARHRDTSRFTPWALLRDWGRLARLLRANRDILIRTLLLLFGFAWFTEQSARFGEVELAANHVLLQFVSFAAFFLDGYAFVAESLVGEAVGRRRVDELDTAVRRSTEVAAVTAVVLALLILVLGPLLLRLLTDIASVRDVAARLLPWVSGYVLVSFAAFQLDGIFIGATRTRAMRNASLASLVAFLAAVWALAGRYDNPGLWTAFICYVVTRALTLGAAYPGLRRSVSAPTELRSASVA